MNEVKLHYNSNRKMVFINLNNEKNVASANIETHAECQQLKNATLTGRRMANISLRDTDYKISK